MDFIEKIKSQAKKDIKTIVLPESEDIRILKGSEIVIKEGFAKIVLLGDKTKITEEAKKNSIELEGVDIINPKESTKLDLYIETLYELRKQKGMTKEEAKKLLTENSRYFASMMVKLGDADGFVSGANHATADTLKPALQIIKGRPGIKTVSAFFIMSLPTNEFGEDGVFIFADCGK